MNAETLLQNFNRMIGEKPPRDVYSQAITEIKKLIVAEKERQRGN